MAETSKYQLFYTPCLHELFFVNLQPKRTEKQTCCVDRLQRGQQQRVAPPLTPLLFL